MTLFAVEVDVLVVDCTFVVAMTYFVAKGTAAVFNGMDEVVLKK